MKTVTLPYSASRRLWFCRLWRHKTDRGKSVTSAHVYVMGVRDGDALELHVVDDHGGVGADVGDVELEGHGGRRRGDKSQAVYDVSAV